MNPDIDEKNESLLPEGSIAHEGEEAKKTFVPEDLLKELLSLKDKAIKFTKSFNQERKQNCRIYEDNPKTLDLPFDSIQQTKLTLKTGKRLPTYVVFQSVESAKASFLDRLFDVIVKKRGGSDDDVKSTVENIIRYIEKEGGLEDVQIEMAHQYALHGFVSAHATITDSESEGEDVNPTISVHLPEKTYFSEDSEKKNGTLCVPYVVTETLLSPSKIKKLYGVEHEADRTTGESGSKKGNKVECYIFLGECQYEGESYQLFSVFSKTKMLYFTEIEEQTVRTAMLYQRQDSVFGFGLAQLLKTHQAEKSIRRSQMIKAANKLAYSKWLIPTTQEVNKKDLMNDDVDAVVTYDPTVSSGLKPEVIRPPEMNPIVIEEGDRLDREIQRIPGLFELSSGNNSSVVKTATGQQIFAESTEKISKLRRRPLANMYLMLIKDCLKLAQANWTMDKTVSVADPNTGEDQEVVVEIEKFKAIDLDKNIELDIESAQSNRDLVRAQQIDMFNTLKDVSCIDIQALAEDLLKNGYGEKSPKRFIRDNGLKPGTMLTDAQTGEQFMVDKYGVVSKKDIVESTPESTDVNGTTPSSVEQII